MEATTKNKKMRNICVWRLSVCVCMFVCVCVWMQTESAPQILSCSDVDLNRVFILPTPQTCLFLTFSLFITKSLAVRVAIHIQVLTWPFSLTCLLVRCFFPSTELGKA